MAACTSSRLGRSHLSSAKRITGDRLARNLLDTCCLKRCRQPKPHLERDLVQIARIGPENVRFKRPCRPQCCWIHTKLPTRSLSIQDGFRLWQMMLTDRSPHRSVRALARTAILKNEWRESEPDGGLRRVFPQPLTSCPTHKTRYAESFFSAGCEVEPGYKALRIWCASAGNYKDDRRCFAALSSARIWDSHHDSARIWDSHRLNS